MVQTICPPIDGSYRLTYSQAAQHSQGIQTLLEAEKEAAKVVQQARQCASLCFRESDYIFIGATDRVQRLKDARSEAQKEIDEYRKSKEDEFNAFQSSVRIIDTGIWLRLISIIST